MRHKKYMAVVVLLLCSCSTFQQAKPETPEELLALAYRSYSIALETAVDLYEADKLDREDLETVQEISIQVRGALDLWDNALKNDGDVETAKELFNEQMRKMKEAIHDRS